MFKLLRMWPNEGFLYPAVPLRYGLRYGRCIMSLVCGQSGAVFRPPAPLVQGNGRMAQKPTTTKNLDSDVAKELEEALDFDLTGGDDDLDIAASMEDLEAQISQAADELARESASDKAATPPGARPQGRQAIAAERRPECRRRTDPRPTARQRMAPGSRRRRPPLQPAGLSPANDDRQKDFRAFRQALNRRASNGIYWVVLLLSLAWAERRRRAWPRPVRCRTSGRSARSRRCWRGPI